MVRALALSSLLVPAIASAEPTGDRLNGRMVPSPSATGALELSTAPRVQALAQPMTLYLNFDGPTIGYAEVDDSRANLSYIDRAAVAYTPYGDATARAAVVQAVVTDWSAYGVTITETRPGAGDYVMAVVSGTNPFAGEAAGIAPLDCMDAWTRNNVVFAFHGANDGYSINEQARTIGQEVAHSLGLEHTTVDEDIMSYAYGPADYWFADQCSPILLTPGSPEVYCVEQHQQFCPVTQQNSHAELLSLIGAGTPDTQSPVLSITSPQDGAQFVEGDDFSVAVDAADEVGVVTVELFSNGESMASDALAPWGWPANGIAAGQYELYAAATDAAGNVAHSDVVVIDVLPQGGVDPSGGATTDDPDDSDDSSAQDDEGPVDPSGQPTADDDDSLPPGYGQDRGEAQGCAIAGSETAWSLLVLAGALLRRRRRS
ncbi:MAG: Ig-like domain-containing protein [Deltaproteobacteria bacterium]|nr:Ig-like domain-containing protein [Nannocystaceae bacterium]